MKRFVCSVFCRTGSFSGFGSGGYLCNLSQVRGKCVFFLEKSLSGACSFGPLGGVELG